MAQPNSERNYVIRGTIEASAMVDPAATLKHGAVNPADPRIQVADRLTTDAAPSRPQGAMVGQGKAAMPAKAATTIGTRARAAFDLTRELPRVADRYGRGPWGRYTLMARRLVEAGVTFVTVDMPHWDDHSNIREGHGPVRGGWIEFAPFDGAIGQQCTAPIRSDGSFDATGVAVGRNLISIVHVPSGAKEGGRTYREYPTLLSRMVPNSQSATLNIDLLEEVLRSRARSSGG